MKTKSANFSAHRAAWTTGVLILSSLAMSPQATNGAPNSPAGPNGSFLWDCIISGGHQQGIAFLNFTTNVTDGQFTFNGYALETTTLHPTASTPPDPTVDRGGDGIGRNANDSTVSGVSTKGVTNVFGFGPVNGPWSYDDRGRIIGFFTQGLNAGGETWPCITNVVVTATNDQGSFQAVVNNFCFTGPTADIIVTNGANVGTAHLETNSTPGAAQITNSVSFVGTVVPNRHLTLTASTSLGKVTFNGVPFKTNLTDISGSWFAYKKENGITDLQLFSLTAFTNFAPNSTNFPFVTGTNIANFPNIYWTTNGTGPGYTLTGVSMLSQRKKIVFAFDSTSTGLSATYGSFTATKKLTNAVTKGVEEPTNTVNFKATWQSTNQPGP
jgi:hypothetical protein